MPVQTGIQNRTTKPRHTKGFAAMRSGALALGKILLDTHHPIG